MAANRYLITAGPTREPIDEVRFISNRSSGRMGFQLAQAAIDAGHEVTLCLGPIDGPSDVPTGCKLLRFETTAELQQLLDAQFSDHDVVLMAAAVADFRPLDPVEGKIPRQDRDHVELALVPTPDLIQQLASKRRPDQFVVAFALEEQAHLEARALEKLARKGADAIVANPLETMGSETIEAVWFEAAGGDESSADSSPDFQDDTHTGSQNDSRPGSRQVLQSMSKSDFARWLIETIDRRREERR
jgi:phosphopantothenoylcysteine decarboxylase/phosphopantothenate--cysteine ligase